MGNCNPNCLATCVSLVPVQTGAVVSPFVILTIIKNNNIYTIGNISSPQRSPLGAVNQAAIKSFDFAFANGYKVEIEIVDEEGGTFSLFVQENLLIAPGDAGNSKANAQMKFQFGWIKTNADGSVSRNSSDPIFMNILEINTNYESGRIYFKLSGVDDISISDNVKLFSNIGTEAQKVNLDDAIKVAFNANGNNNIQPIISVGPPYIGSSALNTMTNGGQIIPSPVHNQYIKDAPCCLVLSNQSAKQLTNAIMPNFV